MLARAVRASLARRFRLLEISCRIHLRLLRRAGGLRPISLTYWRSAQKVLGTLFAASDPLFPRSYLVGTADSLSDPAIQKLFEGQELGGWALDAASLSFFWRQLQEDQPSTIVECGSGKSTLLFAHYASIRRRAGHTDVRVISLEQCPSVVRDVEASLAERGLQDYVSILYCPVDEKGVYQMDESRLAAALGGRGIDLLVIDGPSGPQGCRVATLTGLARYCRPGARFFLDDSFRDAELMVLDYWAVTPGIKVEGVYPVGKGIGSGLVIDVAACYREKRAGSTPAGVAPGSRVQSGSPLANSPVVSILIPCYNAESWIDQSIRSALDQDYPNKEVIVLDDGSTDGSRRIIEAFGGRIRFITGENGGSNIARNRLTAIAVGEWLQYLDADDYLLPDKLTSQVRVARESGDVDVVYSPVLCHSPHRLQAGLAGEIDGKDPLLDFIRWGPLQTTGMLFRREAVLRVGGWKESQPCCQEHELLLRLLRAGCVARACKSVGSVYRIWGENSVSRRDPMLAIRIRMELTDQVAADLQASGMLTDRHRRALFVARMESARSAYARGDAAFARQLCSKAFRTGTGIWWNITSPALKLPYRLALRTVGFDRAERLAKWLRRRAQA